MFVDLLKIRKIELIVIWDYNQAAVCDELKIPLLPKIFPLTHRAEVVEGEGLGDIVDHRLHGDAL